MTVTVSEGTKVSDLKSEDGTVAAYDGDSELASDAELANGNTVIVTNSYGVKKKYTVEILEAVVTPDVVYTYDFERSGTSW